MKRLVACAALLLASVFVVAEDPKQAELAKKPQWQRMLAGDELKTVEGLIRKASDAFEKGLYDDAIRAMEENIRYRIERQGEDHWQVASEKQSLNYYRTVAKLEPADRERYETARKEMFESDSLIRQQRFSDALERQLRYLAACRKYLGNESPTTANALNSIAYIHSTLGRYIDAISYQEETLNCYIKVFGRTHPDTARCLTNLGGHRDRIHEFAKAEILYREALEIARSCLGEISIQGINISNNLAVNLAAQTQYHHALRLQLHVLEQRRRIFGAESAEVAQSYANLAGVYNRIDRTSEALVLYERALKIVRTTRGERHLDTAIAYGNLASTLGISNRLAEAEPLARRSLAIETDILGTNHPRRASRLYNLARILQQLGMHDQARKLLQEALDLARRHFGDSSDLVAKCLEAQAADKIRTGQNDEARALHEKCLDIYSTRFGEFHPDTMNIAIALADPSDPATERAYLERAVRCYEGLRLNFGPGLARGGATRNPSVQLAARLAATDPTAAYAALELSLARALIDHIEDRDRIANAENINTAGLQRELANLNLQLTTLLSKPNRSNSDDDNRARLLQRRRAIESELTNLAIRKSRSSVADLRTIQNRLAADAAIVIWIDIFSSRPELESHWGCVVRSAGPPKWERLAGTSANGTWTEADRELPKTLRTMLDGGGPIDMVDSQSRKLHTQKMKPILRHLEGVKALHVIPVFQMAGVPVEVFAPDFRVDYVASGTMLARSGERPPNNGSGLLAMGDPIFGSSTANPSKAKSLPSGGLLVTHVEPGSNAALANIEPGDVLLKLGDTDLSDFTSLSKALAACVTDKLVPFTVWRESFEKPVVREVKPGKMGFILEPEPAPVAIANRRKTEAMLASIRGGEWTDLPGTRVETNRLQQLFGDSAKVLTDSVASEQTLESLRKSGELAKYRYLHFATHGDGNNVKAFESSLILSQDNLPKDNLPKAGEPWINGQLSAREVLDYWKLNAELVTLSACETAVGKSGGGDGLLGFAQAFLTAGARSVCLSLWKVDDAATALLMSRFYENLLGKREGLSKPMGKAAALDEAKRWLRNLSREEATALTAKISNGIARGTRGKGVDLKVVATETKDAKPFAHPKYWAAFILIGDPN